MVEDPMQILGDAVTAVTVGNGFTVRVTVLVPIHPAAVLPVTLYVVVVDGDAVKLAPVPVGLHMYVFAPVAAIVELWPAQIAAGVADAVTVGNGLIVSVTVAVPVQPAAVLPVTL